MNGALVIALPSKGRLMEDSEALLERAGLKVEKRDARGYRGRVVGPGEIEGDIEIAFLSASEVARELAAGNAHLGITGADLVHETVADWPAKVALLASLGFGRADVVVAVPELWIDVWTMEDLDDVAASFRARHGRRLRIATKYWNLTQGFFAHHGIALYRVVESLGATEGAPAAGTADLIVDITTTGATLAANHLKVLDDGVILRSEAQLAASLNAAWDAATRAAAAKLFERLATAGVAIDVGKVSSIAALR
jgi:ATP phosphoribosyltransferase